MNNNCVQGCIQSVCHKFGVWTKEGGGGGGRSLCEVLHPVEGGWGGVRMTYTGGGRMTVCII